MALVLVGYNQNTSGRFSPRSIPSAPQARATVSTPVIWKEIEKGVSIEDLRMENVPARVAKLGDSGSFPRGRFRLETFF
jgi:DNA primase